MQGLLTSRWSAHRTPSLNQRYFQIPANRCATTAVAVQTRLWMSGKQRPLPRPIPPAPAPSPQTTNSDDGGCENTKMLCMRGEGLINRKELHGTVSISALSGNWALQKAGVTLHGYKLIFTCNKIDEKYNNFILLIDAVLDKDVACVDMNLFVVEKMVKAVVSPCGPIHLEAEQVEQAKRFHELFFNGVYGSLSRDSRSPGVPRQFLLLEDDSSLWNSSNMYLLLPLETEFAEDSDCIRINWKAIHEAASAFEIFRCRNMPRADSCSNSRYEASLVFESSAVGTNFCKLEVIHLANTTAEPQTLKDIITIAIHTGKIYSIVEVVSGSSSHNRLNKSSDGATYAEYFLTKYKIVLQHPEQPLLLVKSGHTPYNLLSSNLNFPGNSVSKKSGHASAHVKRIPKDLYMPPELLIHINVPPAVLKSLYLLPSIMYRMESLMLASQLRSEIGFHPPNSYISSSLILEAITPPICREDFSLERLEYLGDSVLKYVVSSYLYLKCPEKNKMQLSSTRYLSIRNDTLHKQGLNRNVQLYIRHGTFDPLRWVAPGQFIVHPLPCKCEVENSSLPFQILEKNDNFIVLGKVCDSGHKWMSSKTISDCVEALIGAYYVGGGLTASIAVLKWLDIDVEVNTELVEKFIWLIPSWISVSIDNEIGLLESKLGYEFRAKGLLLEAITHSSQKDIGASYCYERLEFLGDAVLELLITWYLFKKYKDMNPGELSELRSASFNYERVAHCVAKHKLEKHLQCCSKLLSTQITEYVLTLEEARQDDYMPSSEAHEVLGAMARSLAGAILMDTRFDMIKVWEVIKPLLSPMVTPDKLQLRPARELTEFLDHHGYSSNTQYTIQGEMVIVEFRVQLGSVCLAKIGRGKDRKGARAQAAFQLLKELKKRGIYPKPSRSQQFDGKSSTDLNTSVRPRDSETDDSKN